MDREKN